MTRSRPYSRAPLRRQPFEGGAAGSSAPLDIPATPEPAPEQTLSFTSLATLANLVSDGICALDPNGHIWYANSALRAMLGRSEAEVLGKRIEAFRQDDEAAQRPWVVSDRLEVCAWRRSDGGIFEARYALHPLEGGEPGSSLLLLTPTALPEAAPAREGDAGERAAAARWVEVIEAVADVALAQLPPHEMMEAMLNRLRPALGLENAAVFLLNDAGDAFEPAVITGPGRDFRKLIHVPLTGPLINGLMRTRAPSVVNGAMLRLRGSGLFPLAMLQSMTVNSMLLTPLVVGDEVIGMLYLGAPTLNHFTQDDIRLARVASARVALAVDGAQAREAEALARKETARAQRRLVILAEASATLVGPLDHTLIAARLVSMIAPSFADACVLYLVENDGMVRRAAVSAPSSPGDDGIPEPAFAAVKRALERLPDEMTSLDLPSSAGESHPDLRKSGATRRDSAAVTRILVESHGHGVGALFLIEGTGRRLDPDDLTVAQGLALRAAVGMEIARLYAELEESLGRVSESAMQLDTVFDSTDACIFVTDAHGDFQRINTYGARMLGLSETSGAPTRAQLSAAFELRDERGEPLPPEEDPLTEARTRNTTVERRITVHRFNTGQETPALARCTPMRDGHGAVVGAVGVMMDITGINQIERQKDEFLGILSHELKTPLTTLKILAQMLAKRMRQSGETKAEDQAARMTNAIVRMERLITDLLDISRIQESRMAMNMTNCDLGALCRDVAREQETTSQRPIQVMLPDRESLPLHADCERLWQVVVNLLSNAIKYSPANMSVTLRVRETAERYLVSVTDQGPGLPREEQRRIFQRFYRAPNIEVQSGSGVGLGLGLFISREIVRAHGGDIWVESEPGHGSVFTFSIPRDSHPASENAG